MAQKAGHEKGFSEQAGLISEHTKEFKGGIIEDIQNEGITPTKELSFVSPAPEKGISRGKKSICVPQGIRVLEKMQKKLKGEMKQ